ncbi:MAG: PAS domain S-box protein [Deltaproteobacteria bacterium]|nr:PAS domain S-box protein [Deltaproteobacteria bacterium]
MAGKPTYEELEKRVQDLEHSEYEFKQADKALLKSKEALRKSEERFRSHFENISDVIYSIDPELRLLDISPSVEKVLGYNPEELIGKPFPDLNLLATGSLKPAISDTMRILKGEQILSSVYELIAKDGTKVWGEISGAPLVRDGRVVAVVSVARDITRRRRAEEKLTRERAQLLSIFDSINQIIYISDPETHEFLYANGALRNALGRDPVGEICYKALQGFEVPCEFCTNEIIIENKYEPYVWEFYNPIFERYYQITDRIIKWPDGRDVRLEVAIDIHEQTLAEKALKTSEEKYRTIFENTGTATVFIEEDTIISMANSEFTYLSGLSREEIEGRKSWTDFVVKEDLERMKEQHSLRRKNHTKAQKNYEFKFIDRQGTIKNILLNIDMIPGTSKSVASLLDITKRRQAEESLKESEERFKKLSNLTFEGIVFHDKGVAIDVNQSFLDMFGYEREEIIGKNIIEILIPEEFHEIIRHNISKRIATPYEVMAKRKDGSSLPVEIQARDVQMDDAEFRVAAIRDITDQKRLEDQYVQSQKMEAVGRLASGVAHDFNNKLTVMMGNAQLAMQDMERSTPLYKDLQEIVDAGESSVRIVRQLLAFARKQTISPEVLHLNVTVEGMVKMLRRLIGEDIDLAWEPGADLWRVDMDPSQVDQILANLCVNAKDAIGGVGKVTVETENVFLDETYCAEHAGFVPGEYVMLAVSDDGAGMDKETLENVFEPFFTTKEMGKGTGLGLSTVYGIVKQNNGFVNAYSEPGVGTAFKVYLPRHIGEVQDSVEAVEREVPRGQGEVILMVEDEPSVLKVAQRTLERLGYTVLAFDNSVEAVEAAKDHTDEIHLLMTDVVMPEMSGKDLAEAIQKMFPHIKTLFMSGYKANAIAHQGVLDKGVHFIQKPFGTDSLARKVREAMGSE